MRRLLIVILAGGFAAALLFGGLTLFGFWKMGAFDPPPAPALRQ